MKDEVILKDPILVKKDDDTITETSDSSSVKVKPCNPDEVIVSDNIRLEDKKID